MGLRPGPAIGETHTLVVERDGATVDVDLTYTSLTGRANTLAYVSVLIGFAFLIFGLLPFMKHPTGATRLFALTGLGLAFAFFAGPYFASYGLRTATASLVLVAILFGFAFLMDLMVTYSQPKRWRQAGWATWAIYGPATLVSAIIVYVIVMSPPATSGLNVAINTMFGLFIVYYFGAAIVAMLQSWAAATPSERDAYGLTTVLAGVLIDLLPLTIEQVPEAGEENAHEQVYGIGCARVKLHVGGGARRARPLTERCGRWRAGVICAWRRGRWGGGCTRS